MRSEGETWSRSRISGLSCHLPWLWKYLWEPPHPWLKASFGDVPWLYTHYALSALIILVNWWGSRGSREIQCLFQSWWTLTWAFWPQGALQQLRRDVNKSACLCRFQRKWTKSIVSAEMALAHSLGSNHEDAIPPRCYYLSTQLHCQGQRQMPGHTGEVGLWSKKDPISEPSFSKSDKQGITGRHK